MPRRRPVEGAAAAVLSFAPARRIRHTQAAKATTARALVQKFNKVVNRRYYVALGASTGPVMISDSINTRVMIVSKTGCGAGRGTAARTIRHTLHDE